MEGNYSLSDIASVANGMDGFGGGNAWFIVILFLLIANGGFNRGDYGQFATAASQQEILFGQQFQNLDNKMDRLGNGIADSTFALNNTIVTEGRGIGDKLCSISNLIREDGEKTRGLIMQNKIESLQEKVQTLEMQNAMCGVVKYPMGSTWAMNGNPFCNCGGCGCGTV